MNNNILYILCGITGSGKSTYAKKYKEKLKAIIISSDEIRHEIAGSEANMSLDKYIWKEIIPKRIKFLLNNTNVIFDACNYNKKSRKKIIKIGKELECKIVAYYFEPNLEISKARNVNRERQVPDWVIEKQWNKWQNPTLQEGFDYIFLVN